MYQPMIREAVALFDDAEKLERAVSELQSHGFDRADLSFLARETVAGDDAAQSPRVAHDPAAPREPATSDTDIRQQRILGTSMAATIAAFAAAGFTVVATGGVAAAAIAATAAAAGVGVVGTAIGHKLKQDEASYLDAQIARGGVVLWVRLENAAAEQRALAILRRYAPRVSVHEFTADTDAPVHRAG